MGSKAALARGLRTYRWSMSRLEVERTGTSPTVVLIHGSVVDADCGDDTHPVPR